MVFSTGNQTWITREDFILNNNVFIFGTDPLLIFAFDCYCNRGWLNDLQYQHRFVIVGLSASNSPFHSVCVWQGIPNFKLSCMASNLILKKDLFHLVDIDASGSEFSPIARLE